MEHLALNLIYHPGANNAKKQNERVVKKNANVRELDFKWGLLSKFPAEMLIEGMNIQRFTDSQRDVWAIRAKVEF